MMNARRAPAVANRCLPRNRTAWPVAVLLLVTLTSACTTRNWYEGMQQSHRQLCAQVPESEREECLAQHDDRYEDYQRKRGEVVE